MKILLQRRAARSGSVLVITLLTALIIGITLATYLTLVSNQNRSTMRSLAHNSSIAVVEAGVEEALTHLYHNGVTNLAANGWSRLADGRYYKHRNLGGQHSYQVTISPAIPPVIVSLGSVPAPMTPSSFFGWIGGSTASAPPPVRRKVRVDTTMDPLFGGGAMVAEGQIDMSGNNVETDSFDSGNPLYSTGGKYDPAKAKDNGDVATNSELLNSVSVGNANIKGHVKTGPHGSVSIGPNGSVGDAAWVNSGSKGVKSGWVSDDMNVDFPPVKVPFTSGYGTPGAGSLGGTNYNYVLGAGNHKLSSVSGKVLVTGHATLYVTDSVNFSGQDVLVIAPGASLKLYVGAPTAKLTGKGILNDGSALSFQYYGLPSNTSLAFSGNAAFTGVIYAPSAAFTLGGGGSTTYDFVGSSVTKTVKMNGHFKFHYDEILKRSGPSRGLIVASWNELPPTDI